MKVNGIALAGVVCALLWSAGHGMSAQQPQPQVNQNCTISVLNRTVTANADGTWILPNVPANFGPVRARVTCVVNGQTISGESDAFTVPANGVVNIPPIRFGQTTPIPTALTITAPAGPMTQAGGTLQLAVTARYPNGSTGDVTPAAAGTTYTVSNPAIATVNGNGVVQAVSSGTVIVQASHEGASGMASIRVALGNGSDTDNDGIPDADELLLGLNPNNPVDAMEDFDRDNLTNLQEYQLGTDLRNADTDGDGLRDGDEVARGTNPLLRDTDGDGIGDGLEVQTGSNPLDAASFNLSGALSGISITPAVFTLTFNTIEGDVFIPLAVRGALRDGSTIDLTSRGTNYASNDLAVCSFSPVPGRVFAGQSGGCTITATVAGFSAVATGTVTTFAPTPLSSVALAGPGNGVDVAGSFVYVAVGVAGLQVVDVGNRAAPQVVATLGLPGGAFDVKVDGTRAFVAAGAAGLHVVDVNNPFVPRLLGSVDTPGDALDLRPRGNLVFVADGPSGLQVVDVTDPAAPRIAGSVATAPGATGVDVGGSIAIVTTGAGVRMVDVSNPASPMAMGAVNTPGDARDVVVDGGFAYVADHTGSLRVIDVRNPAAPVLAGATPQALGGVLLDVARMDTFVFGADIAFFNVVPIIDVSNPNDPRLRANMDFDGEGRGRGIAADGSYVYLGTDTSRLYIGQYRIQQDFNGVPPTVTIESPAPGATFVEGELIRVTARASDDLAVASVTVLADGVSVATDTTAPYEFSVTAPTGGVSTVTLGAEARDLGNNVGVAVEVVVNVIPDPLTGIQGRVVLAAGQAVTGATVTCGALTAQSLGDGSFTIANAPTVNPLIRCSARTVTAGGITVGGIGLPVPAVRAGVTTVGDIVVAPVPVVTSISPKVLDALRPPATLQVTGNNLLGSVFSFAPELAPIAIAVTSAQVDASGTTASLSIAVSPTARGRFTLIGTNAFGAGDTTPSPGNSVTLINQQDDVDSDGDGYPDGLELLLGSDPADALSIPAATAREDTVRFTVLNSTFPFDVQQSSIQLFSLNNTSFPFGVERIAVQWFSVSNTTFPAAVQQSATQWFSVLNTFVPQQPQTLVSPAVSVLNDPTVAPFGGPLQGQELSASLTGVDFNRRLVEGETVTVAAAVSGGDGTEVASFSVNGVPFADAARAPYELLFTVPAGVTELRFAATVRRADGRTVAAQAVVVGVDPDTGTSVTGRVVNAQGLPVANALVEIQSSGLAAEYFDAPGPLASLPDITGMTLTRSARVTAINTRGPAGVFGPDPLGTGLAPDYAARYTGWLSVGVAGSYRFFLGADEGARLTIGGATVVDMPDPVAGGFQESSGVVDLPAGLVPIEITFYQSTGNAELQLSVVPPGGTRQVVPPSALVPASAPFAVRTDADGRFTVRDVPLALENVGVVVTPPTDADGGVILPVAGRIPAAGIDVGEMQLPRRP